MKLTRFVIAALVGAAGAAHAQIDIGESGAGLVAAPLVEIPGSMEFSGRMIAKPVQTRGDKNLHVARAEAIATLEQGYTVLFHEDLVDHFIFEVPEGRTEQQVVDELTATGLFEFVEPDWVLYPIGCPNDSKYNSQWHHGATKMQSCDAWDLHRGNASVSVGICDTGVQTNHPDLLLNRLEGYNAVDRRWESNGGQIGPVHSHGTQTTGCAAANGNNGAGVAGVGWNLSHRMMRVSNHSSGGSNSSTLTHAALTSIQAGDRVANVSYSGVNSGAVRSTATQIKNMGGLLCWSAGNDGAYLNWGNRDSDDVIVVGATASNDQKSNFSAYGPSVDLVAPGSSVYTTTTGSGYGGVSGTSFSSPLTAGLIGLIWSYNPGLTPDEVEQILKLGCDDLGSAGPDNTYGHGRINSYNSLLLADGGGGGGGGLDYPFLEVFEGTVLNSNVWSTSGGVIGTGADNEPSAPYSINLDLTDSLTSADFDLSALTEDPYVSFYCQRKGVESGESLIIEYRDAGGQWKLFEKIVSDGANQPGFSFHRYIVPAPARTDSFAIRFRTLGSHDNDDWYVDDVAVAPFQGNPIPFYEGFAHTTLADTTWDTISGAVVATGADKEPSAPYSLNFDGTDSAITESFLLDDADFPTYVSFFVQHKGVESGKRFVAEYRRESGSWAQLATFTSSGADQTSFQHFETALTSDAYHDGFALRFRALGSDGSDDWYLDDIRIGDEFDPGDCVGDFNGDGEADIQDLTAFFNAWNNRDAQADINGDGDVDTQDVTAFLNAWNAGCP